LAGNFRWIVSILKSKHFCTLASQLGSVSNPASRVHSCNTTNTNTPLWSNISERKLTQTHGATTIESREEEMELYHSSKPTHPCSLQNYKRR
jgi:hypothetical protein